MQLTDLLNRYGGVATNLGIDLVAIFVMTYVLYFRRHWRADLLLSYVALNIGIFVTMSLLTQVRVDIAVGFGLFAILSIIRLGRARSPSRRWPTTSSRWSWAWSTGWACRTAAWSWA